MAPTTILSLPPELIDVIAPQFSIRNGESPLSSCSLVSKAFLTRFQPLLFRDIDIHSAYRLHRFADLLLKNSEIGRYVHRAAFHFPRSSELKKWGTSFSKVACRLTHLVHFEMEMYGEEGAWGNATALRKGLRSILASQNLVSIQLSRDMVFAIPPHLLFSNPTIQDIWICSVDETPVDIEYWAELDAADMEMLKEAGEAQTKPPAPPQCTSLSFTSFRFRGYRHNWFPYVLSNYPHYLVHLTHLELQGILQSHLPFIQTLLHSLGEQLRELSLCLYLTYDQYIDLSRNTGLRRLTLRYSEDQAIPYDGLTFIQTILSELAVPLLGSFELYAPPWNCPGINPTLQQNFPRAALHQLDTCFARFSSRSSCLKNLVLCMVFAHHWCRSVDPLNPGLCHVWDEFRTRETQYLRHRYFPRLCSQQPEHLNVRFRGALQGLEYVGQV